MMNGVWTEFSERIFTKHYREISVSSELLPTGELHSKMGKNDTVEIVLCSLPSSVRHLCLRRNFRQFFFKILLGSLFLASAIVIIQSIMQSDFIIIRFKQPVVSIQEAEMSRCCVVDSKEDVCGRWYCLPCQNITQEDLPILTSGNNAFFHETSGAGELNTRQACAVESLALLNHELDIYLLTSSHSVNLTATTMKSLSNYSNIRTININLGQYFLGTPLEHWYFCTTWNYGEYAVSHLSDALRFLTIYKYGGYYFDLDVIQLRSSESLRNFVVADVGLEAMAVGAFHVEYDHPITRLAVEEFSNTYRKDLWAHNGPELFTRLMQRFCGVDEISLMISGSKCNGFRVLIPESFYPYSWSDWEKYFAPSETLPEWSEKVIGLHVWNKLSAQYPVNKSSDQLYAQLARTQCPLTFETAPEVF